MKYGISALIFGLACGAASAHELTPTYPEFRNSFMEGISVTTMELYNAREEVEYYAINVYDDDWRPIPFSTKEKIIQISHLGRSVFDLYIRNIDLNNIEYICTTSRLLQNEVQSQGVSSRVCSRVK